MKSKTLEGPGIVAMSGKSEKGGPISQLLHILDTVISESVNKPFQWFLLDVRALKK